jgi:hypothetical protein
VYPETQAVGRAGGLRRTALAAVPAVVLVRLGLPALGALVFLAVLAAEIVCWVLGSDVRAPRVTRMLLAWRGNPSCLPPGGAASPRVGAAPVTMAEAPMNHQARSKPLLHIADYEVARHMAADLAIPDPGDGDRADELVARWLVTKSSPRTQAAYLWIWPVGRLACRARRAPA